MGSKVNLLKTKPDLRISCWRNQLQEIKVSFSLIFRIFVMHLSFWKYLPIDKTKQNCCLQSDSLVRQLVLK